MTVHRLHRFTLDEATLDSGLAIKSAGSGLPRRITGAITDYQARILALSPTGYWPLDTDRPWLDASGNGYDLATTGYGSYVPIAGHGIGGDARTGPQNIGSANQFSAQAASTFAGHDCRDGSPFTLSVWMRSQDSVLLGSAFIIASTQATPYGNNAGWTLDFGSGGCYFYWGTGTASGNRGHVWSAGSPNATPYEGGRWVHLVLRYTGASPLLATSWSLWIDGKAMYPTDPPDSYPLTIAAGSAPLKISKLANSPGSRWGMQDLAIWAGTLLTDQQVKDLSSVSLGKARWSRAFVDAATVRGVLASGNKQYHIGHAVNDRRCYLSVGGARTEIKDGEDPAYAVGAGDTLLLDVEPTHHTTAQELPYLATSLGEGPALVYEEADPPTPPQYVAAIEPVPELAPTVSDVQEAGIIVPDVQSVPVIGGE